MEDHTKDYLRSACNIVFTVVGLLLAFLLFFLLMQENVTVKRAREETGFVQVEEYTWEEKSDPDSPSKYIEEFRFTLDDPIEHDTCLAFYAVHQNVRIYLDDTCVYELYPSEIMFGIDTPGAVWVMIPLYYFDRGKEVRIDIIPVYNNVRFRQVKFLLGSELAIYKDCLKKSLPMLVVSCLSVLAGLLFIVMGLYQKLLEKKSGEMIAFGVFAVLLGIWRFMDTQFSAFMFPQRPVLIYYLSLLALIICAIPLAISQRDVLFGKLSYIYSLCVALVCFVQLTLQFRDICDIREMLPVTQFLLLAGMVMLLVTYFRKWEKDPKKFWKDSTLIGWCILAVGLAADVIVYYINGNTTRVVWFMLAFLIYVIIYLVIFSTQYRKQQELLVEKDNQVMNSRITTMMSQIRSHFIFNES